jgi:hypothetical protein
VRGNESLYKALRYTGTGTDWVTETASIVDDLFDYVTAPGVTTIAGVWTVGEPAPPINDVTVDRTGIPEAFFVDQNFPNPFNPSTRINYGLPAEALVGVRVYNLLGQEITTLFEGRQPAGRYTIQFDARAYPSGVYFYRVRAGSTEIMKRMILMK